MKNKKIIILFLILFLFILQISCSNENQFSSLDSNKQFITYPDSSYYYGTIKNQNRCGYGTYTWKNGVTYSGSWEDNQFNGNGEISFKNNWKLTGYFKTGMCIKGELEFSEIDAIYKIEFINNQMSKKIKIIYSNGATYYGSHNEKKINGQGSLTYANGDKYVGNFLNGKKDGYGKYYFSNKSIYSGQWKNDKLIRIF